MRLKTCFQFRYTRNYSSVRKNSRRQFNKKNKLVCYKNL